MFAADLSWTDPDAEKVGERRQRKARERAGATPSIRTTSSRNSRTSNEESGWMTGLKKARSIRANSLRPGTNESLISQRTIQQTPVRNVKTSNGLKDPTLQPAWTYASSLSKALPSGASLDIDDIPDLDGDASSRRTDSTEPQFGTSLSASQWLDLLSDSDEDEGHRDASGAFDFDFNSTASHQSSSPQSPRTCRARSNTTGTERERKDSVNTPSPEPKERVKRRPAPLRIESALSLEALRLHDAMQVTKVRNGLDHPSFDVARVDAKAGGHRPLSQWECLTPIQTPTEVQLPPKRPPPNAAVNGVQYSRFHSFIRRMENAGPKALLERLNDDWQDVPKGIDEGLILEKQLWLLTAFQIQNLKSGGVNLKPQCDTGRVLELYGNISEVYQMSAMQPGQMVHYLTTKPPQSVPLPGNVSYLTVRDFGVVPLPYPEDYFSHIRASSLPSLVPSAKLPDLFKECHKLLAPGGMLEVRIMDAAPARQTSGPLMRMWIEDRLSTNLERLFRCSKPCSLISGWLENAGFDVTTQDSDQNVTLPCAVNRRLPNINQELSAVIGRSLWRDVWGDFVDTAPGEPKWWWDDPDIMAECVRRQTVFECRAIYAYKW